MRDAEAALAFYQRNYVHTGFWILEPGKRQTMVGDRQNRRCRFCGRRPPAATFRMKAHAIPEALGNRHLLTAHECDDCNQFFGRTIENDFGNWSKPMRTLARIRGKTGKVPSMKGRSQGDWRIDDAPGGLSIMHDEDDTVLEADHEERRVTFRLSRDPYRPVAVLKAFVKMGLVLMPEHHLRHFRDALDWISNPNHADPLLLGHRVMMETLPGPAQSAGTALALLRRKDDYRKLPFYFLTIAYGNQVFQVTLPCPQKDWVLRGHEAELPLFPHYSNRGIAKFGSPQTFAFDLTGQEVIRGQVETATFSYDDVTPVSTPVPAS